MYMKFPNTGSVGRIVSRLRQAAAILTDKRIALMSEIITGIKVIKMYAWEKPFANLLNNARREEINMIRKSRLFKTAINCFAFVSNKLVIVAILVAMFSLDDEQPTSADLFLALSLYDMVQISLMTIMPYSIATLLECQVSVNRIQSYLETSTSNDDGESRIQPSRNGTDKKVW